MKILLLFLVLLAPCMGQLLDQPLLPMRLDCNEWVYITRHMVVVDKVRAVKFLVEIDEIALGLNWKNLDKKLPCLVVTNDILRFPNGVELRDTVSFQMRREYRRPLAKAGTRYYSVTLPEDFVKGVARFPIYFDMRALNRITYVDHSQTI